MLDIVFLELYFVSSQHIHQYSKDPPALNSLVPIYLSGQENWQLTARVLCLVKEHRIDDFGQGSSPDFLSAKFHWARLFKPPLALIHD